jgi:hypothetical protein
MVMKNTVGLNIGLLAAQKNIMLSGNESSHFRLIACVDICFLLVNIPWLVPGFVHYKLMLKNLQEVS